MSEQPFAIEANQSVRGAMNRLWSQDIRRLPVLDNLMLDHEVGAQPVLTQHRLVGIVPSIDVPWFAHSELEG